MKYQRWMRGLVVFLVLGCWLGAVGIEAAPKTAPSLRAGQYEQVIQVHSERELLRAIGPNRMLLLEPGVYYLRSEGMGEAENPYVTWGKAEGGWYQLKLENLTHFKIQGVGKNML